ncbi:MAG TPA: hypothetical protein VHL12_01895 [Gemmatimonadaceae bacterium]|jgi:hypothetical protein|nr:hypothetical protein [Gemmatimonadaceae bacterium]
MRTILLGASLVMAATVAHEGRAQGGSAAKLRGIGRYAQVTTGSLVVPAGTTTSGSVMVLKGNLDVYGNVDGAATAVLGDVIVHEGGRVRGGAVALMGHVRNEGGSILGVIKDVGATHNRSTVSFGGRPRTTIGSLVASVIWLVVLLLLGTFVLFFLGDYLRRAVEVVTNETGRSLFAGILGGLASIPALIALVVAMAITIIGVFFIPIGVAAFFIALSGIGILGFLAVAQVTGTAIARKSTTETAAGQELQFLFTGILAFSALWIVAAVFTWFPVLGAILRMLAFSVTFVAVATGFGAVILSWWRTRHKKNAVAV